MDFEAVLHYTLYVGVLLIALPLAAGASYYALVLHQAIRNEERYQELGKRKGRRIERLRRMEEAKRLSDPFFHFNVKTNQDIESFIASQIDSERRTGKIDKSSFANQGEGAGPAAGGGNGARDSKIQKAIQEGRLVLLETAIEDCAPGMVVGRPVEGTDLTRGDELDAEMIQLLAEAGFTELPILYNPKRIASAISGAA
ncbi:MAG: hypothetical protein KDB07_07810 [Planctomycetes bacterium]|nr:hypothetical protein [Planctomycetota bacterium]